LECLYRGKNVRLPAFCPVAAGSLASEEIAAKPLQQTGRQGEAGSREHGAGREGPSETDTMVQPGKNKKHRERRNNVPERVPNVFGDFFTGLCLEVEPNHSKKGYLGQGGDQTARFVASSGTLGNGDRNRGSEQVFGDEPSHGLIPSLPFLRAAQTQTQSFGLNHGEQSGYRHRKKGGGAHSGEQGKSGSRQPGF
jgi:hypothetical protein